MELALKSKQHLKARAFLLGDRLDLKAFKIADCLATTPLTVEVDADGGVAVLFRYGVVVLFGVESLNEVRFTDSLKPMIIYAALEDRERIEPIMPVLYRFLEAL